MADGGEGNSNTSNTAPTSSFRGRGRKNFPGNRTDIGWKHGEDILGNSKKVKCNYCSKIISAGISRFKHHLAGTREDSEPCPTVPDDVRILMLKAVAEAKEASMKKRRLIDIGEEEENPITESEIDNSQQTVRLATNAKGKGKFSTTGTQSTINQMLKKPLKEEADDQLAEFFYTSVIPFNAIKNPALAFQKEFFEHLICRHYDSVSP